MPPSGSSTISGAGVEALPLLSHSQPLLTPCGRGLLGYSLTEGVYYWENQFGSPYDSCCSAPRLLRCRVPDFPLRLTISAEAHHNRYPCQGNSAVPACPCKAANPLCTWIQHTFYEVVKIPLSLGGVNRTPDLCFIRTAL